MFAFMYKNWIFNRFGLAFWAAEVILTIMVDMNFIFQI